MSVSRVVALLTPVFAALAGYVAMQAAQLPGAPVLDAGQLTAVFVAGAGVAGSAVWKWLAGRSVWEAREHDRESEVIRAGLYGHDAGPVEAEEPEPPPVSLRALEADVSRALAAVRAVSERVDNLPRAPESSGVGALSDAR